MSAVEVTLALLIGTWLLWRIPTPRPTSGSRPRVAVIVPARDEAATLPALLESLRGELVDGDELVVVDDHSTDATAAVAAAGGARLVAAPPLPAGWTGKAWACATGAEATANELLVFLDADVAVLPGGLARVVGERAAEGLLSVQPFHVVERPYERLSAICNVVSMMGIGSFTPRRRAPRGAFGPCLVTTRAAYDDVGGHRGVASSVLDDVELARCYRAVGRPVRVLGGRGSLQFRMYPSGVRQLVDGWTKNMAIGARRVGGFASVLTAAWVALLVAIVIDAALARDLPSATVYALLVAQVAWMLRRIGRFGVGTALLFPLPLACFVFVFARSVFRTAVHGEVAWKGRTLNPQA